MFEVFALKKSLSEKIFYIFDNNFNQKKISFKNFDFKSAFESASDSMFFMKTIFIKTSKIDFTKNIDSEFDFRDYQYAIAYFNLSEKAFQQSKYLNIEIDLIIMNRNFFYNNLKSQSKL